MDCPHCEGHGELEFQLLEGGWDASAARGPRLRSPEARGSAWRRPEAAAEGAYERCPRCEGSGVLELEEGGAWT
ncbi:hypothetical protein [Paenibacillus sp. B01]|uniref:hypothetical protein n=1 Tax=Paenibacillus sp. B01 TaxID=2660554 RepID=UPI00129B589A|nr:hypothetical protein [Paenibacillus sp. B01]QGG56330.1 hypothetical protein GE073_12575 [Paenibacillus sp. B01]